MIDRRFLLLSLCWALAIVLGEDSSVAEEKPEVAKPDSKRVPWTTSKVVGSPEKPPPFKSVRVFPQAQFHRAVQIARCPGSERLFITEHEGKMFSLKPGSDSQPELFFDLPKELKSLEQPGEPPKVWQLENLYGLAFHPKFEQNRYCYVGFALQLKNSSVRFAPEGSRLSRFTVTKTDPPRIDPASEEILFTWQAGGHNGCDMHFGPDGMLYVSTGDGRDPNPPDPINTGQDCSDLLSSILRVDVDRRDPGKNYAIPPDNPFVGMKDVRPEIWAYGFRNPYRMSFDRLTGDLWAGDVGWELWESVHKIQKGGNYGWSIVEGRNPTKPDQEIGPTPILPPTIELPHTIAASVTGGYVYRGKRFPELVGAYIFGDWETRRIWGARFDQEGRLVEMPELVKPSVRVVTFGEDNAGELYYLDYDTGMIHTLERNNVAGVNAQFPTRLSETGLFQNVTKLEPAPGVVPFSPAVNQWQDGARTRHFFALPGESAVTVFDKPRKLPGQVFWHEFRMQFPADAVLVKHLTLDTDKQASQPVETQLLHYDGEDWRGYTFAWRQDGSDADLVPAEGAEAQFSVHDSRVSGGKRTVNWTYHSRNQCLLCHNAWSEYALSFSLGHLNSELKTAEHVASTLTSQETDNQLLRFSRMGYITRVGEGDKPLPAFDRESAAKERSFHSQKHPAGSQEELDEAARAYLHTNCAHCHRFGGGGGQVVLEMDFSRPLKQMEILDLPPKQGAFGIPDAQLIKPGHPYQSVLLYRMAKFGHGRMPHLGSELPDGQGLKLIARWIESLGDKGSTNSAPAPIDPTQKPETTEQALPIALQLAATDLTSAVEPPGKVPAWASALPPGSVHDLFDGYFPVDPKNRKLGGNPKPATILGLTGDAKRGEALFFTKEMKCASCHKIGERGIALGPDLSHIGKTRQRPELLESLLQPSRQIDLKFAQFIVQTTEGKAHAGLLVRRDDKQVVLRDAENKELVIPGEHVELVRPNRVSLMPEGLLAGLVAQEAADLLEYLSGLR